MGMNERGGKDADGSWHGAPKEQAGHRALTDRLRRAFRISFDFVTDA
jgi:hypothetical protein